MSSRILRVFAVALVAALPYYRVLDAKFTYDDKVAVIGNPDVYTPNVPLTNFFIHDFWGNDIWAKEGKGWTHMSWRPFVTFLMHHEYVQFGGSPRAMHVFNVIYYAAACMAVYWFLRTIMPSYLEAVAFWSSMLFAAHPVHAECVANVTSRAETLSALFMFATLAVYSRHCLYCLSPKQTVIGLVCVLLGSCCALLCKETALVLPVLVSAVELATLVPLLRRTVTTSLGIRDKAILKHKIVRAALLVLMSVLLYIVRISWMASG
jgi:hypothetical protein